MFEKKNINAIYKAFQVDRGDFKNVFYGVRGLKIAGGAVSMPFKREAFECVDKIHGIASEIGTINTFCRSETGEIVGYNTDYLAAVRALPEGNHRIYLLGGGGVAASVALAINNKRCGSLTVISRKPCSELLIPSKVCYDWKSWTDMKELDSPDIVVNCTPLGMTSSSELHLPNQWWSKLKKCIDLTFRPEGNAFALQAQQKKVSFVDGKMFSRWQAVEQFKIYTGIDVSETEI